MRWSVAAAATGSTDSIEDHYDTSAGPATQEHMQVAGDGRYAIPPNTLTLERIPGLIIPIVQSRCSKPLYSGTLATAAAVSGLAGSPWLQSQYQ